MDLILKELGELVLGSVPTMVLFLLLIAAYAALVRRPLDRILAERRARTSGAIEEARKAISAAEATTAVYEEKLRASKAAIYQMREQKLKQWQRERETSLEGAKQALQQQIVAARAEIEKSAIVARQQLEGASAALGAQILRAVLPAGAVPPEATQ